MNFDNICFTEQLTFLRYVNEHYLLYSITILTFASLFILVWILKKYTYFEKHGVTRAAIPTIPYGNFGEVLRRENSLHVFLWRHYNRFKRKGCKLGGLFLFMKPVVLVTDSNLGNNNNNCDGKNVFPRASKLERKDFDKILSLNILTAYVEKFNCSINGALSEKLLKNDASLVLKDFLLESTCLAFGFQPFEIVNEINKLLKEKYDASCKFYLSLCVPLFFTRNKLLSPDLKKIISIIIENRKKNDVQENDVIQSFIKLFNESSYSIEDVTRELFNLFADILTYSHSTLMMCLYEVANSTEVQEEVLGEIRRFNKKHKSINYENLQELIYLTAVVKETLRKYPPIATTIKATNKDDGLQKYPNKNGLIFRSILGAHRDPQFYTKPEAFEPDRFLEKIDLIKDKFIPFGKEPGSQLYVNFVSLQVTLFLISIFSSLEVKMKDDGSTRTFKYKPALLYLSPCEDLNLSFIRI